MKLYIIWWAKVIASEYLQRNRTFSDGEQTKPNSNTSNCGNSSSIHTHTHTSSLIFFLLLICTNQFQSTSFWYVNKRVFVLFREQLRIIIIARKRILFLFLLARNKTIRNAEIHQYIILVIMLAQHRQYKCCACPQIYTIFMENSYAIHNTYKQHKTLKWKTHDVIAGFYCSAVSKNNNDFKKRDKKTTYDKKVVCIVHTTRQMI